MTARRAVRKREREREEGGGVGGGATIPPFVPCGDEASGLREEGGKGEWGEVKRRRETHSFFERGSAQRGQLEGHVGTSLTNPSSRGCREEKG